MVRTLPLRMQSCEDDNQSSRDRHAAEHVAVRIEGKAERSMVAVVGVDLACASASCMYGPCGTAACTAKINEADCTVWRKLFSSDKPKDTKDKVTLPYGT